VVYGVERSPEVGQLIVLRPNRALLIPELCWRTRCGISHYTYD